jgi:hypothetical protein
MRIRTGLGTAWREPLVQFSVLGALLYLTLQAFGNDAIRISAERLEDSRTRMARLLDERGNPETLHRESDLRVVGDELLYREAVRLGLDRDDPVIRQHLAQKLIALTEAAALAGREPTAAEEQALFDELRKRWTVPARVTFCHVFSSSRAPRAAPGLAQAPADLGDCEGHGGEAFPLGARIGPDSEVELASRFGTDFAQAVFAAPVERWVGPLSSRYGWHWVRIVNRPPAEPPDFEAHRPALRQVWAQRERARARAELLRTLARRERPKAARDASPELQRGVAQAVAQLVQP